MIIKNRIKVDGQSYIIVKNCKSRFEQLLSKMTYPDLLRLHDIVDDRQKSLINLELFHRYSKESSPAA